MCIETDTESLPCFDVRGGVGASKIILRILELDVDGANAIAAFPLPLISLLGTLSFALEGFADYFPFGVDGVFGFTFSLCTKAHTARSLARSKKGMRCSWK